MRYRFISATCRFILAAMFLYAGASKAWGHATAAIAVNQTMFEAYLSPNLRWSVIIAECALGTLLLFGKLNLTSAAVSLLILSTFTGVILKELVKAQPKPCGCTSVVTIYNEAETRRSLKFDLGRNLGLMACAAFMLLSPEDSTGKKIANLSLGEGAVAAI